MNKHAVEIVAIVGITIITVLALSIGEDAHVILTAVSIIGGLGGYIARQNAKHTNG